MYLNIFILNLAALLSTESPTTNKSDINLNSVELNKYNTLMDPIDLKTNPLK